MEKKQEFLARFSAEAVNQIAEYIAENPDCIKVTVGPLRVDDSLPAKAIEMADAVIPEIEKLFPQFSYHVGINWDCPATLIGSGYNVIQITLTRK